MAIESWPAFFVASVALLVILARRFWPLSTIQLPMDVKPMFLCWRPFYLVTPLHCLLCSWGWPREVFKGLIDAR